MPRWAIVESRTAVLDAPADDVELPLEGQRIGPDCLQHLRRRGDEDLPDDRFAERAVAPSEVLSTRHGPPAEEILALFAHDALEVRLAAPAVFRVGRQEDHADAVLAEGRQAEAEMFALLFEEAMGHLHEDAGAVAGVRLAAAGAAVFQVEENLDRLLDDVVRFAVVQVDDEADAARIVFVPGVIQPLPGRCERLRHFSVSCWQQRGRKCRCDHSRHDR